MENSDPLFWYGLAVLVVCGLAILVPYLRGKSDLLTAWNVMLVGLAAYTGLGCIEVKYSNWSWPGLRWFQPTREEVSEYILYSIVFIATLLISHHFIPLGTKVAQRCLRHWPPMNGLTYITVMMMCALIAAISFSTMNITFIGPLMFKLSHKSIVFASVFAFMLWYRQRINLAWLFLFLGVFAAACIFAMLVSPGRRLLLSVFVGPVVAVYWLQARYWRPRFCLTMLSFCAVGIIAISVVYSSFRWFNKAAGGDERNTANIVARLGTLSSRGDIFGAFFANKLHYFSQWNVEYGLLTKRYMDMGDLKPEPLNTLKFIVSYPIPRRIWRNKPETISIVLAHNMAGQTRTTWPVGPVGHGFYEGGIPALMLYALLLAVGLRFMDEPIRAQPSNPFLISMHAAALPHVLALTRGDFGTMTLNVMECVLFVVIVSTVCRVLYGTERAPTAPAMPVGPPPQVVFPAGPLRGRRFSG